MSPRWTHLPLLNVDEHLVEQKQGRLVLGEERREGVPSRHMATLVLRGMSRDGLRTTEAAKASSPHSVWATTPSCVARRRWIQICTGKNRHTGGTLDDGKSASSGKVRFVDGVLSRGDTERAGCWVASLRRKGPARSWSTRSPPRPARPPSTSASNAPHARERQIRRSGRTATRVAIDLADSAR